MGPAAVRAAKLTRRVTLRCGFDDDVAEVFVALAAAIADEAAAMYADEQDDAAAARRLEGRRSPRLTRVVDRARVKGRLGASFVDEVVPSVATGLAGFVPGLALRRPLGSPAFEEAVREAQQEREQVSGPSCRDLRAPEPPGEELLAKAQLSARNALPGGIIPAAALQAAAETRAATPTVNGDRSWQHYGKGPLVNDNATFTEASDLGLQDIAGRVEDFAQQSPTHWYAAVAQGGVWETTDAGAGWTSISDTLPDPDRGLGRLDPCRGRHRDRQHRRPGVRWAAATPGSACSGPTTAG